MQYIRFPGIPAVTDESVGWLPEPLDTDQVIAYTGCWTRGGGGEGGKLGRGVGGGKLKRGRGGRERGVWREERNEESLNVGGTYTESHIISKVHFFPR